MKEKRLALVVLFSKISVVSYRIALAYAWRQRRRVQWTHFLKSPRYTQVVEKKFLKSHWTPYFVLFPISLHIAHTFIEYPAIKQPLQYFISVDFLSRLHAFLSGSDWPLKFLQLLICSESEQRGNFVPTRKETAILRGEIVPEYCITRDFSSSCIH